MEQKFFQLIEDATKAVRANFKVRNAPAFTNPVRQAKIKATRRRQIREWIAVIRIANNPRHHEVLMRGIPTGPLMSHDLRNRVILVGMGWNGVE